MNVGAEQLHNDCHSPLKEQLHIACASPQFFASIQTVDRALVESLEPIDFILYLFR